tara:strand:+ start:392 stop:1630 length:1239 start_codon:yes stop_codon:yes gene_type:complete
MHYSKKIILQYGFSGFLFSFTALPLFIVTPVLYENKNGLSLAIVGLILMIVRFTDAITDPIIGRCVDITSGQRFLKWIIPSIVTLVFGFFWLMNPPEDFPSFFYSLTWLCFFLLLVSISNGAALLAYQSWVLSITEKSQQQLRFVTSREMFTLVGVIVASYFATQRMFLGMSIVVIVCSFFSIYFLFSISSINLKTPRKTQNNFTFNKVIGRKTRVMFFIFGLNALANSIPALLFIFFVQDILNLKNETAGLLLIVYFLFAIISMPFWAKKIDFYGPVSIWCFAILISITAFIGALFLNSKDFFYFLIICSITGFSLGAELLCPPMILAKKINELGHRGHLESSYFGVLNLVIKLSLAFASGTVLPLLSFYGYSSVGDSPPNSLIALQFFYAGLPCFLKMICVLAIYKYLNK